MQKSVLIKVVPPAAIKIPTTSSTVRTREWNLEKLLEHLKATLEPQIQAELGDDVEVQVVTGRQPDIRLNNVKPKGGVSDWKEGLGEAIGEAMGDLDPEEFLTP